MGRRTRLHLRGVHKLMGVIRCTTQKRGYHTEAQALTAADRMMTAGRVLPGCHLTPYHCAVCGEWHVYNRRIVFPPEE